MIGRLLIAGLCGGVIGHERENRRKPAGVRTHTVVGVASALMMLISKYGFNDVLNEYTKLDPSRVAARSGYSDWFLRFGHDYRKE